jgi:hypothetical protein
VCTKGDIESVVILHCLDEGTHDVGKLKDVNHHDTLIHPV